MPTTVHRSRPSSGQWLLGVVLPCLVLLQGCGNLMSVDAARENAGIIARSAGLASVIVSAGGFRLQTYQRGVHDAVTELVVFIEGDGRAWRGRHRPPSDPTPTRPVSLMLAASDPAPALLYIGRPCQYLDSPGICGPSMWTSHRYGESVINAINEVIDDAQRNQPLRRVVLVGHSGGGVVAALVAARRSDVSALYTLAAPLAVSRWTELQGLSPLTGSLDPAGLGVASARVLAGHRQWHFIGDNDPVVPVQVPAHFIQTLPVPNRARLVVLEDVDHQCCWQDLWPGLVQR